MFFRKKKVQREDDRVWATTELKWNGIVDEIIRESGQYMLVLTVAHFEKTAAEMRKQFQARNLRFKDYGQKFDFRIEEWKKEGNHTLILMAEQIVELGGMIRQSGEFELKDREVLIVAAEHHPLVECDQALLAFMSNPPCRCRIRFHSAFDEPLLKMFGGDRVISLVRHLGWDEKEYISHSLISSAIEKAQKKVKEKAKGNQKVESMDEWFHYNVTAR